MYLKKSLEKAIAAQNKECSRVAQYGISNVVAALVRHGETAMASEFSLMLRNAQDSCNALATELVKAAQKPSKSGNK